MKKTDVTIYVTIMAILLLLFMVWKILFSTKGAEVVIKYDNQRIYSCMLTDSCLIAISSDGSFRLLEDIDAFDGEGNLLLIDGGFVDMISADCPDKICVGMPRISNRDESIVCMPHKLIVVIE